MNYGLELTGALYLGLFVVVGAAIVLATLGIARLLAPHNMSETKLAVYECGEIPFGGTDVQFSVSYYLVRHHVRDFRRGGGFFLPLGGRL